MANRKFRIVLVKPSHYDRDGYVIQWWRSMIPSNSLASVYGLLQDCAATQVLGPDVEIEIDPHDECNTVIDVKRLAQGIRDAGAGFVGLVGVQSNQFPRAVDLGRQFRALGIPVVVGGFHVSGCLSMLKEIPADVKEAMDLGMSLYAGEGENQLADLLRDIAGDRLKPVYNYLKVLPDMTAAGLPILPRENVNRMVMHYTSFDAGRGCPFQCSFCTIINVQGRKSRFRSADEVEQIVRLNAAQGVTRFVITDDNFARNKNWEPILDRLIHLREVEGMKRLRLQLQVDTLCHRIPGFIEKAARAGTHGVFIGLENINPESLMGTKKRQNKIWEYREMLQAWRAQKVITWAGYILGFPNDTPETIKRDIAIIQRELPLDILEFFFLTPLPGSEDHRTLLDKGVAMDPDMNKYDLENVCTAHPRMTKAEWEQAYDDAWTQYYSDDHVATLIRRAIASGMRARRVMEAMVVFAGSTRIEGVHPLQFGIGRRKLRRQRRHGLPIENPLLFYPRRAFEFAQTAYRWGEMAWRYQRIMKRVAAEPDIANYTDEALRVTTGHPDEMVGFVNVFAEQIPHTHGAPVRKAAVG